jgi:uncharacterized damage-inducible protein DinB
LNTSDIQLWYQYHYWAHHRILATAARVTPEQYAAPTDFGIGFKSLRATLVHTLDAEWGWRRAFQNHYVPVDAVRETLPPAKPWDDIELTEVDLPTLDALKERWQVEEGDMRAYLGGLDDSDLNGIVRYMIPGGIVRERVLWHCLIHVVNHGTQHRSEAAALLTSYGYSPGDMDFTVFLNQHFNLPSA